MGSTDRERSLTTVVWDVKKLSREPFSLHDEWGICGLKESRNRATGWLSNRLQENSRDRVRLLGRGLAPMGVWDLSRFCGVSTTIEESVVGEGNG